MAGRGRRVSLQVLTQPSQEQHRSAGLICALSAKASSSGRLSWYQSGSMSESHGSSCVAVPLYRAVRATYGIAEPTFTEGSGAVTVTFKAEVVAGTGNLVPGGHQAGTKLGLSRDQVQVLRLAGEPATLPELMEPSGRTNRTKFRDQVVAPLLDAGLLEMTIPDKPRSSKQQYRTTDAGRAALASARKA